MLHAKIVAYKDYLVFELLATKSIKDEVVTSIDNPNVIGQVIMGTKESLGVSKEAIELIGHVKRCRDDIGDIDWFKSKDGKENFAWLGGPRSIKSAANIETPTTTKIGSYVEIPNEIPMMARTAIDEILA